MLFIALRLKRQAITLWRCYVLVAFRAYQNSKTPVTASPVRAANWRPSRSSMSTVPLKLLRSRRCPLCNPRPPLLAQVSGVHLFLTRQGTIRVADRVALVRVEAATEFSTFIFPG